MQAPTARAPRRADREDDTARVSVRELSPVPRVRARGTSSPPIRTGASGGRGPVRFGPYLVHERLGDGGMATVHRAVRVGDGGVREPIALKRMWSHLGEDRGFVEAFVQEARLASRLRHDNIARAFELGRLDGTYYIAMELVTGPTLSQIMVQSRTAAGAIPLPIIVEILIQLCDALDHAHTLCDESGRSLGIIHRDVSPANVMISSTGTVKLIDFGIAKAARSRAQTQAGLIKGKLGYVAPEYTYGQLDARADLFAVGVIAHELITGERLFLAETELQTIGNVREKPIQPPSRYAPQVSRELDDIVLTALQRMPERRWQNAAAMRAALAGVARELDPVTRPQLRAWIESAFLCEPRRDSAVAWLLETWEPTRIGAAPERGAAAGAPPVDGPAPSAPGLASLAPAPGSVEAWRTPLRMRTRTVRDAQARSVLWPWIVVLLFVTAIAAAAWSGWWPVVFAAV